MKVVKKLFVYTAEVFDGNPDKYPDVQKAKKIHKDYLTEPLKSKYKDTELFVHISNYHPDGGWIWIHKGDYILTNNKGQRRVCSQEELERSYLEIK